MGRRGRPDPHDQPPAGPEYDDPGGLGGFAVGPSGVGPVMGFGSDDFFPVVADGDPGRSTSHRDAGRAEPSAAGTVPPDRDPAAGTGV